MISLRVGPNGNDTLIIIFYSTYSLIHIFYGNISLKHIFREANSCAVFLANLGYHGSLSWMILQSLCSSLALKHQFDIMGCNILKLVPQFIFLFSSPVKQSRASLTNGIIHLDFLCDSESLTYQDAEYSLVALIRIFSFGTCSAIWLNYITVNGLELN